MKNKFLNIYTILLIILLYSCNNKINTSSPPVCMSSELYNCFNNYFSKRGKDLRWFTRNEDGSISNTPLYDIYYGIYFYELDSGKYFVIWSSFSPPKFWFNNNDSLNYLYYNINKNTRNECDIFIVTDNIIDDNPLFSNCSENIKLGDVKQQNNTLPPNYSNPEYPFPSFYKYHIRKDKIIINELDYTPQFVPKWFEIKIEIDTMDFIP